MEYYIIHPPSTLANYVRFFWVLKGDMPYTHRTMASGCPELVFHYKGTFDEILPDNRIGTSFRSGLHAQAQKFRRFTTSERFGIFGIYLYPYAIPHLFAMPAQEVSNEMIDLTMLAGAAGRMLEEKIIMAPNNEERVKIMCTFFEQQLARHQPQQEDMFSIIQQVIQVPHAMSIEDLAENCFLSRRQFERKFKTFAGFSPKLYTRILRFQTALDQYNNKTANLTDIAYRCGYYDQSHFIRDFKEFSGYHPKAYFSGKAEGVAWRDA